MFNCFRKHKSEYKRNIVRVMFGEEGSIIHGVTIQHPDGQKEFHGYSYDDWATSSLDLESSTIKGILCDIARENGFSKMVYHYRTFDRKLNVSKIEKEFVDVNQRRRLAYYN